MIRSSAPIPKRGWLKSPKSTLALATVALLVLGTAAIFGPRRFLSAEELPSGERLGLLVLWYIDLTLTATIAFVLLRSLLKLFFERRSHTPGSKFRVRLVLTHIGLALLPAALVFVIASDLLNRSIDRWFSPVFENALSDARKLGDAIVRRESERASEAALSLAATIRLGRLAEPSLRPELAVVLSAERESRQLDFIGFATEATFSGRAFSPELTEAELPEFPPDFFAEAFLPKEPGAPVVATRIFVTPKGRLLAAAVPAENGTLVAGVFLSGELDRAQRGAIAAHQAYLQREQERADVKAASILLFLAITLLVLFAAVWVGLYVGRRLTTPIQALVESTRRVTAGDLTAKVDVPADDELRGLVESYNEMVDQLGRGKNLLLKSNADLQGANATLETGRRFVRAILESATTAIVALDTGGSIRIANRAAAALLDEPGGPRRLIGRQLDEFAASPAAAAVLDLVGAVRNRALAEPVREFVIEKDGETRTYEARLAPLETRAADDAGAEGAAPPRSVDARSDGSEILDEGGWVVAVEDVTGVVNAQRSAAWQEVARRMAHEVKNPLTPIRLSAERMRRKLDDGGAPLERAIREGTETIIESVGTLNNLVEEFSRFARMPKFEPKPTDLALLVKQTATLYDGVRPSVAVVTNVEGSLGEVTADPDGLRRVLINLLDNALEATPDGGRVELRAERRGDLVEIEVSDTGRGIPPGDRARIFQPYFSTKGRGTGLGLALARRIATDHGGTIRVEANEPIGSRFVVTIPA